MTNNLSRFQLAFKYYLKALKCAIKPVSASHQTRVSGVTLKVLHARGAKAGIGQTGYSDAL